MTGRRDTALAAALDECTVEHTAGLTLLRLTDGQLRLFLKPSDVAALCQVSTDLVIEWIHEGRIAHARDALGTKFYPIPVTELPKLVALAKAA